MALTTSDSVRPEPRPEDGNVEGRSGHRARDGGSLRLLRGVGPPGSGKTLLITSLEGWLLTPMLMGKVASMNRVAVFVGLLFWSWAWGVWGLLLAVPMMMSVKAICDHVEDLKPVGRFLGE